MTKASQDDGAFGLALFAVISYYDGTSPRRRGQSTAGGKGGGPPSKAGSVTLPSVLMNHDPLFRLRQWPYYAQFLPIVERFDTLFESLGWLTRQKNT